MTTYRRFCCNDLLRIGPVNLSCITAQTHIFLSHMVIWPDNCIVANMPGGLMNGYIFGSIEGTGEECTGSVSILSLASMDMMDLARNLSNMLDDSCDMRYKAYSMKVSLRTGNPGQISLADKLGYVPYDVKSEIFEMRKPLYRILKKALEETERNQPIKRDILKFLCSKDQLQS